MHNKSCVSPHVSMCQVFPLGTPEERGIHAWRQKIGDSQLSQDTTTSGCYDLPFGMSAIRRWGWTKYIPICPTFRGHSCGKKPDKFKHNLDDLESDGGCNHHEGDVRYRLNLV